MTHFSKKTIASILFTAFLSACGGQGTTDTASNTAQKAAQTTQAIQTTSTSSSPSGLLASLAVAYPNGQIPAASAAQAAKELAQNPAALHLTAATMQNAKSALVAVQPQAVAADYKAVTRIQNTTLTGAYFFTIYDTERDAALASNPNWQLEGTAFIASVAPDPTLSPVHRFRNKLNGSYLYTIYDTEKADITANYASTFAYEGVAWYARKAAAAGWSPLYRFRNLVNGTYLFSAYESEKASIEANYSTVFQFEGVAYYVKIMGYDFVANPAGGVFDKSDCIQDHSTGLMWQGQTPADTGLRANNMVKTNFDNVDELQVNGGYGSISKPTQVQVDDISNSVGFQKAVNATNLCGHSDWRIPTVAELMSIAKTGELPMVNYSWFSNMDTGRPDYNVSRYSSLAAFWTATAGDQPRLAKAVNFYEYDYVNGVNAENVYEYDANRNPFSVLRSPYVGMLRIRLVR